jgi:hypothetical protein
LTSNPHRGAYQAINRRSDRTNTVRRVGAPLSRPGPAG